MNSRTADIAASTASSSRKIAAIRPHFLLAAHAAAQGDRPEHGTRHGEDQGAADRPAESDECGGDAIRIRPSMNLMVSSRWIEWPGRPR
jgi:hypothetical protein